METDIPALRRGRGLQHVGGFSGPLINDLTTSRDATSPALGAAWYDGDPDSRVAEQADVFDGTFVSNVLI